MVTLATDDGWIDADLNIVVIADAIPWLGSVVVGALCLHYVSVMARKEAETGCAL